MGLFLRFFSIGAHWILRVFRSLGCQPKCVNFEKILKLFNRPPMTLEDTKRYYRHRQIAALPLSIVSIILVIGLSFLFRGIKPPVTGSDLVDSVIWSGLTIYPALLTACLLGFTGFIGSFPIVVHPPKPDQIWDEKGMVNSMRIGTILCKLAFPFSLGFFNGPVTIGLRPILMSSTRLRTRRLKRLMANCCSY
jgi:hypothetical protein